MKPNPDAHRASRAALMAAAVRRLLFLALLLLLPAGCGSDQQYAEEETSRALPRQTLLIGLLPEQDIFVQKQRYTPIAEYLSRKAGVNIELKILRRYGNVVENFRLEGLDGAFFGSFTGAMAIRVLGVEPIARPEYPGGVSTYYGMVFVRKDSGIKNIQDMKGRVFVFVDKATTAGWLLPLHYFHEQGMDDHGSWFKEAYFSGTHEDAIYDVLNHRADMGAAKDLIFEQLAQKDPRIKEELEILAVSPRVPSNTLALRESVSPGLKDRIKKILLTMQEDPEGRKVLAGFGATRFLETSEEDYRPVFDYARDVGLDLSTYQYRNR